MKSRAFKYSMETVNEEYQLMDYIFSHKYVESFTEKKKKVVLYS